MALLFSAVTVIADDEEMETLVSGIPEEYDDLEGWAVFDDFMDGIASDTVVDVHVETYLYGDGETEKASVPEIAYILKRISNDDMFLPEHCDNIADSDFNFLWTPSEGCVMEHL